MKRRAPLRFAPARTFVATSLLALAIARPAHAADRPVGEEEPPTAPASEAEHRYQLEYLGFQELGVGHYVGVGEGPHPYQGKYKRLLPLPEFYRLVGRADLADRYENRRTLGITLMAGGGALAIAATIVAGSKLTAQMDCEGRNHLAPLQMQPLDHCPSATPAFLVAGVGLAVAIAGAIIPNTTNMAATEARALADQHNLRLKKGLGLTSAEATPSPRPRPRWQLAPYAAPSAGGLVLAGAF
jgi:hypothetical protein